MLKNNRNWDCSSIFLTPGDQTQKDMPHQYPSNMPIQVSETADIIASSEKKDTRHDNDTANGGLYEDTTSETINLLSVHEDEDEPSTGIKWPPLTEHKKVISYQWRGLSKKPSFLKTMTKGDKEEKKRLISKVKKAKIHQNKMESFKHRSSKTAVNKAVLCPVVGSPENGQDPEWAEKMSVRSYFMQKILALSEQRPMEDTSQLDDEYLHFMPKTHQHQAAQVHSEVEKRNHLISAEISHLQLCEKKRMELEQGHLSHQHNIVHNDVDEEDVDPSSVDGLQIPTTHLSFNEESAPDACTGQDTASYSYDKDSSLAKVPSSAFVETSSLVGGIPITGSLERNNGVLMNQITAVKNRQDFLEQEYLQLRSRYHSDNNIIMELLHEQHLRYSQLLVYMNDLQEQHNAEIVNMKDIILFMEEKMAYQSYEGARDMWDEVGLFQSRLSKMEAEQKEQNSPTSVNEGNSRQVFFSKVKNLWSVLLANRSQIVSSKAMMDCLPVIVTFLLLCLFAVSTRVIPFITAPLFTTLIIMALCYGVLHNLSTASVTHQRSRLVTQLRRLFNRFMNYFNLRSAFGEAWELFVGG